MFCRFCGTEINDQAKFCSSCGKPQYPIKKSLSNDCWLTILRYILGVVFIIGGILPYLLQGDSVEYNNFLRQLYNKYETSGLSAFSCFSNFSAFFSPLFYFSSSVLSVYTGFQLFKKESNSTAPMIVCGAMHVLSTIYSGIVNLLIYCFPGAVISLYHISEEDSVISAGKKIIKSEPNLLYYQQDNAICRAIISAVLIALMVVFLYAKKRYANNTTNKDIKTPTVGNILFILSLSLLQVVCNGLSYTIESAFNFYAVAGNNMAKTAFNQNINLTAFFLFILIVAIAVIFNRTKRWILAIPTISVVVILGFIALIFSTMWLENIGTLVEYMPFASNKLKGLIISSVVILIAIFFWFSSLSRNKIPKWLQIALPISLPIIYVGIEMFVSFVLLINSGISYGLISISFITIIVSLLSRANKQKLPCRN